MDEIAADIDGFLDKEEVVDEFDFVVPKWLSIDIVDCFEVLFFDKRRVSYHVDHEFGFFVVKLGLFPDFDARQFEDGYAREECMCCCCGCCWC